MTFAKVVCLGLITAATGVIIAYDCNHPDTKQTVAQNEVRVCPDPESDYLEETRTIQLVQEMDSTEVRVQTCLIEVSRHVSRCEMSSNVSAVKDGLSSFIQLVGAEECKKIHRNKSYSGYRQILVDNLQMNATTQKSSIIAGTVGIDGTCQGVTYVDDRKWEDAVVEVVVKITLTEYTTTVNEVTNKVEVKGGDECPYSDGYCFDSATGETVWDRLSEAVCDASRFTVIYEGIAGFVKENNTREAQEFVVVEAENHVFAIKLLDPIYHCLEEILTTEHPKILVVEKGKHGFLFKPNATSNANLMTYMYSDYLDVEQAYERNRSQMYRDVIHRQCIQERELSLTRLALATTYPENAGMTLKKRMGYVGRVMEGVLYIFQCVPRLVSFRQTNKCYQQLPINVDEKAMFLAPITHFLQEEGEEVQCKPFPPMFKIEGKWTAFDPFPKSEVITPQPFPRSMWKTALKFVPIQNLGKDDQDQVKDIINTIMYGSERKPIDYIGNKEIANLDTNDQGYSSQELFNTTNFEEPARKPIDYTLDFILIFGVGCTILITTYLLYKLGKYIIELLVRTGKNDNSGFFRV